MVDRSSPRNSHIRPLVRAPKMSDWSDRWTLRGLNWCEIGGKQLDQIAPKLD